MGCLPGVFIGWPSHSAALPHLLPTMSATTLRVGHTLTYLEGEKGGRGGGREGGEGREGREERERGEEREGNKGEIERDEWWWEVNMV